MAACDGAASKMSATWTYIFLNKYETLKQLEKDQEEKKNEPYNTFLTLQREIMEFGQERVKEKMELERARFSLVEKEAWLKMDLEKKKLLHLFCINWLTLSTTLY